LEARDGNEALEILNSEAKIDLLLTDVKLPHVNGFELVERSSARRPSMKVIFITGYSGKPMSNEMRDAGMQMISKPYKVDELVSLVRDLLGQKSALGSAIGRV
jgi:DNA-binding NtrC family response regulator